MDIQPQAAPPTAGDWPESERWRRIVAVTREWGYFSGAILRRADLWGGKRMLDVGMGAGPHSVTFIEGGAAFYAGVDPLVGTGTVRDFRSLKDPSWPAYQKFDFTTAEIMAACPRIKLYAGLLEEHTEELRTHKPEVAILSAVSEHLQRPHEVIRGIWQVLDRGGLIWISHCNYYAWTGHHRNPRSVAQWNEDDAEENRHVDWRHLEPSHPDYVNPNYNRVRLDDLRVLIDKYFEIVGLTATTEAVARLTPDIRRRYAKYTLAELLGRNVYFTGRKRDTPLDTDLSGRQFFHPAEEYLAHQTYAHEDIAPFRQSRSVTFTPAGELIAVPVAAAAKPPAPLKRRVLKRLRSLKAMFKGRGG